MESSAGHPPLYVTFPSIHQSSHHTNISGTIYYLILHMGKMVISPGALKGQKQLKIKHENYIHHASYLRNGIAYDHNFWYSCLK